MPEIIGRPHEKSRRFVSLLTLGERIVCPAVRRAGSRLRGGLKRADAEAQEGQATGHECLLVARTPDGMPRPFAGCWSAVWPMVLADPWWPGTAEGPWARTGGGSVSPVAGIGVAVPGGRMMLGPGDVGPGRGVGAGAGATAWGWSNGLGAVITNSRWPAGLRRGALIPSASRAREVDHFCVCAGQRLAALSASFRSFVRIYASEQCPRQDSNLRSRLRRAWHHPALTSGNVPAGDPLDTYWTRCG